MSAIRCSTTGIVNEYISILENTVRSDSFSCPISPLQKLSDDNRFKFIFCGLVDDLERFKCQIEKLPNVIFTDWIDNTEKKVLFEYARVGLAPYKNKTDYLNSIPTKIIEYLSAGLPIITGLKGNLKSLITNYECGIYCEEFRSKQIIDAINNLYSNTDLHKKMSHNALTLFEKKFNANDVYKNLVDHVEKIKSDSQKSQRFPI